MMMMFLMVVHQCRETLHRKVVRMLPNLMPPQNKPDKMGYNKVQKEPHKENKMLNKPQTKALETEKPAAKEVPKEAVRVQAKALEAEKAEAKAKEEAERKAVLAALYNELISHYGAVWNKVSTA